MFSSSAARFRNVASAGFAHFLRRSNNIQFLSRRIFEFITNKLTCFTRSLKVSFAIRLHFDPIINVLIFQGFQLFFFYVPLITTVHTWPFLFLWFPLEFEKLLLSINNFAVCLIETALPAFSNRRNKLDFV